MYDVVAMGELLVDFIQNGCSEKGNPIFEANPGGAMYLQCFRVWGIRLRLLEKWEKIISDGCLGKQSGKRESQMKGCCMTGM